MDIQYDSTWNNPTKITSPEQMENWLLSLEGEASASMQEALKAQIQVIKYVQSPNLIDTTFDTLIDGLKKSLKKAENEDEKEKIRGSFSRMIQNYVFFLDARVQYEIEEHKDEARKMFLDAGEILIKSIKEVALMAVGGKGKGKIAKVVIYNIFDENNNENARHLLNRIYNWWNKEKIIAEKKEEFYDTLYKIVKKLGEYQSYIGESTLIYGMIERYKPDIICHEFERKGYPDLNVFLTNNEAKRHYELIKNANKIDEYSDPTMNWEVLGYIGWGALGTIIISLLLGAIRLIIKLIIRVFGERDDGWFAEQMYWTFGLIGAAVIVFFVVELSRIVIYRCRKDRLIRNKDKVINRINAKYDAKAYYFTQPFPEAQRIVEDLDKISESFKE